MKRRTRNTVCDEHLTPTRVSDGMSDDRQGGEFGRFCYVVGVRSIRCLKAAVRFTRGTWRPMARMLYRVFDRLILRHGRHLQGEWRALRVDFARATERVKCVGNGRRRAMLRELLTLPILAVRRHRPMLRTLVIQGAPVVAVILLISTVWYWRQANFVLALEYDGQPMGYIANESTYNQAISAVESMVINADDSFVAQRSPRMVLTVASGAELLNAQQVSNRILDAVSGSLADTSGLYVNGSFCGALPRVELERLMTTSLAKRNPNPAETVRFFAQIEIVDGLYPVSAVSTEAEIASYLDMLPVQVSHFITYDETVKYDTVIQWDETKLPGESRVSVKGQNGKQRVTVEVVTVNGEEQYRAVVSTEMVQSPVTEVIVKGGSEEVVVGDGVATGTFKWPLPYTKVISSPFASRWGSFHGAIDISNGRVNGKPIIASDGGKVIEAGWHNSYGYYVLIDHGNGFKTRYAHCSSLNVKVGQKVAQGEYIADVGNTGYSFGAHLHFEVILNGQLVDPMNYVEY